MRSSTMTLALVASAALPGFAAPISKVEARSDLEARLAFGAAAKALGGGIATGGLFAALSGLVGKLTGSGEPAPARRSLEARQNPLVKLATSIFGVADDLPIGKAIGQGAAGGVVTGAAISGTTGIIDSIKGLFGRDVADLTDDEAALLAILMAAEQQQSGAEKRDLSDRSIFSSLFSSAAKTGGGKVAGEAVKTGLGSILGGAALGGIGSAIAGSAVGQLFQRDIADLTDDEAALLTILMAAEQQQAAGAKRELDDRSIFSSLFSSAAKTGGGKVAGEAVKTGLGSILGGAALGGIGSAIAGSAVGQLFQRDLSELTDDEAALLTILMAAEQQNNGVEARALKLPSGLLKGLAGTVAGLGASVLTGGVIDSILSLFGGGADAPAVRRALSELSDEDIAELKSLFAPAATSINDLD